VRACAGGWPGARMSLHGRLAELDAQSMAGPGRSLSLARVCAPGAWAGARVSCCRRHHPASTSPLRCVPLHLHAAPHARPRAGKQACAASAVCENMGCSLQEIFGVFAGGGRLIIVPPGGEKDTQHMARLCKRHGVTSIAMVPSLLEALLRVRPMRLSIFACVAARCQAGHCMWLRRCAGTRLQCVHSIAHRRGRRRGIAPATDEAVQDIASARAASQ